MLKLYAIALCLIDNGLVTDYQTICSNLYRSSLSIDCGPFVFFLLAPPRRSNHKCNKTRCSSIFMFHSVCRCSNKYYVAVHKLLNHLVGSIICTQFEWKMSIFDMYIFSCTTQHNKTILSNE